MFVRVITIVTLISAAILMIVLTTTSPSGAGPFGLLALFVSAYITFVGLASAIIYGVQRLFVLVLDGLPKRVPWRKISFRRAYHFAVPVAAGPVMLIGLQSVSPVGIREFALVLLFEIIACLYVSKRIK